MTEEEDIIILAQEQARQQKPILQTLASMNDKLAKQYLRTNKSISATIDLTVAHIDEPLGLEMPNTVYLWLSVEKADSPFSFILKQTSKLKSNPFIGTEGANLDQHEFTEVYITNSVSSGIAIIQVGWRE